MHPHIRTALRDPETCRALLDAALKKEPLAPVLAYAASPKPTPQLESATEFLASLLFEIDRRAEERVARSVDYVCDAAAFHGEDLSKIKPVFTQSDRNKLARLEKETARGRLYAGLLKLSLPDE